MNPIGVWVLAVWVIQSFDQPAEEMFDAFRKKELIGQWMFGSLLRAEEVLHLDLDGREGVRFLFWSSAKARRLTM